MPKDFKMCIIAKNTSYKDKYVKYVWKWEKKAFLNKYPSEYLQLVKAESEFLIGN